MQDDELIAKYIEQNPDKAGLDEAQLRDYFVPVWAVAGYLNTAGGDIEDVATGFGVAREAIEAAAAYYRKYKCLIDNRLAANAV